MCKYIQCFKFDTTSETIPRQWFIKRLSACLKLERGRGSSVRTGAMALVDSEAAVASHCDAIDRSHELRNLCIAAELTTFMRMALAIGTPQVPATDDAFRAFATELNGGVEPSLTLMSLLRRLHFEAVTMVVAHLFIFFLWYGRSRSEAGSLHVKKQFKITSTLTPVVM